MRNITNCTDGGSSTMLPVYGKGEECFNAVSHLLGIVCCLLFCGWAFKTVSMKPTPNSIVSISVYLASMLLLYSMSMIYHGVKRENLKKLFRIFDHCTIFVLIAGCYTPFCLVVLWDKPAGKLILLTEWLLAIIGIALNLWNMHAKPVKIFSQTCYVVMGWMITLVFRDLLSTLSLRCIAWLVAGGLFYTVGIIFYALGKRVRYMHCIWHVFVLLGTIAQFISLMQIF